MQYSWDPLKAARNLKKHGVSFPEAVSALEDPHADFRADWARGEIRQNVIGYSNKSRLLFVVTIEIADDEIRIISARRATSAEREEYESP